MKKLLWILVALIIVLTLVGILTRPSGEQNQNSGGSSPLANVVGEGEHCGGNMTTAPVCASGLHCAPEPGTNLPFGDVGGVCVAD